MWLSERAAAAKKEPPSVTAGEVTVTGNSMGVFTTYEAREAIIVSPGGYAWRPKTGGGVLVMKGADGESYIAGRLAGPAEGLGDGEVRIFSDGGAEIILKNNGDIVLRGRIAVEGSLEVNGEPYRPCACVPGG